ncbi:MAG: hypothetical protein KAT47_03030, partial [Candidatus Aegiribacteria sp.]|nr:hypothetical protein [Candidatus Aegiribacteria sp.]
PPEGTYPSNERSEARLSSEGMRNGSQPASDRCAGKKTGFRNVIITAKLVLINFIILKILQDEKLKRGKTC